jgi:FkbM family methyltransferase
MFSRIIWQYWETKGHKPAFIDGLHEIARRNAGVEVVLVTPETLPRYLPDIPGEIFQIAELAHKADMIRTMLIMRHGGMWLDSDAIVLRKLDWIFDLLDTHEFVCFNDGGKLMREERPWGSPPWVRVNCFASRAGGLIVSEWVRQQHAKFPRTKYRWQEVGSEILHPLCLWYKERVKVLPFEAIAPVPSNQTERFAGPEIDVSAILRDCYMVMLTNHSLRGRAPLLSKMTVEQIASGDYLLSAIMRNAISVAGQDFSRPENINILSAKASAVPEREITLPPSPRDPEFKVPSKKKEVVQVKTVFGPMKCFKDDLITNHLVNFGAHTRPELAFLLTLVDEGNRVFDLGAHIGTFAVPIAKKVGTRGGVLAVEGVSEHYDLLHANVSRNGVAKQTQLLLALIAPGQEAYQLKIVSGNSGASHLVQGISDPAIKTFSLDELAAKYFVPDLVKIDIEGLETWAILETKFIRHGHPIIYAEVSPKRYRQYGSSVEALDAFFRETGYRFFRNIGARNARHDRFVPKELGSLLEGGEFFDVMAVHSEDKKLGRLLERLRAQESV